MLLMDCLWLNEKNQPYDETPTLFAVFRSSKTGKLAVTWKNSDGKDAIIYNQDGETESLSDGSLRDSFYYDKATLTLVRTDTAANISLDIETSAGIIPVKLSCSSLRFKNVHY